MGTTRRMRTARWLLAGGVLVMVVASLVAPPQPELWQDGASCEVAPCGTLEDPPRYRVAVAVWFVGAAVSTLATPFAVGVGRRPRAVRAALALVASPLLLVGVAAVAFLVSLWTSAPGGWTVLLAAPLTLVGWVAGQARRVAAARSTGFGSRRVVA